MQNDFIDYAKKMNNIYSQKNISISEILSNFSQLSDSHNNSANNSFKYSSYNYLECTKEEQERFYNDQLQLIESLVMHSRYSKSGVIWNWKQVFDLILDDSYAQVEKTARKLILPNYSVNRLVGDNAYLSWNGLQIIDLDIKDYELSHKLKPILFNDLKKYKWFLGICTSASKKSLHIWTKITSTTYDIRTKKIEYICNFRQKYSYLYINLLKHSSEFNYTKEDIIRFIDMAMCKPQQGIFISSDKTAMMNTNFEDLGLDVNFSGAIHNGIESINWISHPDLKDIFYKLEWFNEEKEIKNIDISKIRGLEDRDLSKEKGKMHYKHVQRWQLANTLTSLYGYDLALKYMTEICAKTPFRELQGDVKTASIHNKPISEWAIKELNKNHGFNLKLDSEQQLTSQLSNISKVQEQIDKNSNDDPIHILNNNISKVKLYINENQYLSDIKDEILKNLSKITVLEAGAGYGKTEMIKSFDSRVLLVLPFNSIIESKIAKDEKTANWLYYYGNKRPTLEELLGDKCISMTIDKFSNINLMELDEANFDYIVVDESHLLFISSFRDVMTPAIQRIANCKSKVILMTGTPTAENLFFPNVKHIKVIKTDNRIKEFNIKFVRDKDAKLVEMCESMAEDITNGKRILYPSNAGTLYYEKVVGLIQQIINENAHKQHIKPKEIKTFYYKKANFGQKSMDDINYEKSIKGNDLIMCSSYLSVGVDICDKYKFAIYFDQPEIAQDIEQYANRIRNNNLYIYMFLEMFTRDGDKINYNIVKPLDLSFSQQELIFARNMLTAANDMIERNMEEAKYNPLIQSLLSTNKFLKYDENEAKYFIDETTYKLNVFQERYTQYAKQLNVMTANMKYYGYVINTTTSTRPPIDEEKLNTYLVNCKKKYYDWWTEETLEFLNHLTNDNIDIYKEFLRGDYALFKDNQVKYASIREENNIYAENIEILEKNIPIAIALYKFYDCEVIRDIFKYCIDKKTNKLNYSKLDRIKRFVIIENNRKLKKIDFPIYKYIKDCHKFAKENPKVTKSAITKYIGEYAVKYTNSIKGLIVEDAEILNTIYDLMEDLWKVIIVQTSIKGGNYLIRPFELLWERKDSLSNIYGNITTKIFFDELIDNMKEQEENEIEDLPELEMTDKISINDIKENIKNIVHNEFDYDKYSKDDNTNERFINKQKSTNRLSNLSIDISDDKEAIITQGPTLDLFDD